MNSVRGSVLLSFGERYLTLVLGLVSMVVIARLLRPEEIGLFSVASAFVGMAQVVRDFGVGSYLIQESELTRDRIRSALGVTLVIGCSFFVIMGLLAPVIADFYDEPRLVPLLRILAASFLAIPFGSTSLAILRRNMAFRSVVIINIVSVLVSTIVSVGLAWSGVGPASLAWGMLAGVTTTAIAALVMGSAETRVAPGFRQWRRVVQYGSRSTATGVITEVAMNMNDLVVARVMGFGPAAILSRAQGVMNLYHREALGAVRSVAFPAFARVHRAGGDLEAAHVESLGGVTAAGWTFYGFVAIFPLEILRFLFGPQWDAAAPLVPIFSLAGAMAAVWSLVSSVLLATGRVDLNMRAELVVQPLRILLLIGVVLYLRNLAGYAWTFALVFGVCIPVLFWFKQKIVPTAVVPMFRILSRSAIAATCALVAPVTVKLFVPGPISVPVLLAVGFCTAVSWVLAIVLVGHPLATHLPWVRNVLDRSRIPRTSA